MNLLALSPWYPYPPDNGSRFRAFHLLRELAKHHRVRLVAGVQEDVAEHVDAGRAALGAFCDEVETFPWRWWQAGSARGALRSLFSLAPRSVGEADNPEGKARVAAHLARPCDAVLVFELGMVPLLPAGVRLPPAIVDQVEVTGWKQAIRRASGNRARLRAALTAGKAYNYWRRMLRRRGFAAITAVSEDEAGAVRRVIGGETPPVIVVPNGVDVGAYRRTPGRSVPGRLIYNGALSYGPNLDAVRWFAGEILPLVAREVPEAHLVVTGRSENLPIADLRADPRVHLTGFLPDLRFALDEAVACVVPLRYGGGTRLKILEAWAAELPVVATSVGAAGLDARDGEHLRLADTPEAFAAAVRDLLREPERIGVPLAQRARRLACERYDWSAIGADLSDLLEQAAAAPPLRNGSTENKAV